MRLVFFLFCVLMFSFCKENKEALKTITSDKEQDGEQVSMANAQEVDLSIVMGKFDPSTHEAFVLIDKTHADREGLFLQKESYDAFIKMRDAAASAGIRLTIRSATRNFDYQKGIWERKWAANKKKRVGGDDRSNALNILEYSSMPSTSRHHWGTDIDLNSFENSWFESGEGLKLYEWMLANAADFGYCQVYTAKDAARPDGYNEEKWHWSYLPIAEEYFNIAKSNMTDDMISGFNGAEVAKEIGVVGKYILGIDKSCQ